MFTAPDGSTKLLTSNVGDARILLIRNGEAVCLTEEHVPDM
jgi:serine/threonine protein phosphatase PrpC